MHMLFHPVIPFLGINPGEICKCEPRDMYKNANSNMEGKQLEINHMLFHAERISESQRIHITEYHTAVKISEQLLLVTTWINLRNLMLG